MRNSRHRHTHTHTQTGYSFSVGCHDDEQGRKEQLTTIDERISVCVQYNSVVHVCVSLHYIRERHTQEAPAECVVRALPSCNTHKKKRLDASWLFLFKI